MSHDQDDTGEDCLAGIDLDAWRVPPPAPLDRPSVVARALAPATTPARRPRVGWVLAGMVIANAAIAIVVAILIAPGRPRPVVTVRAAGGGSVDEQARDALQRLEQEQHELEGKLAEVEKLRALIVELSDRVHACEQQPGPHHDHRPPEPADCDEVYCVLEDYGPACCARFHAPAAPVRTGSDKGLPDALDRAGISSGIEAVKARVAACGRGSAAGRVVKVHVLVAPDGRVTNVEIQAAPDAALGACVAAAVQHAVFPATRTGGAFSYPFVF